MANKYPWLKHDTDAHLDPWLRHLVRSVGHDAGWAYWGLLELLHRFGNGDKFTRNFDDVCSELLVKRVRFRRILVKMSEKWDNKVKVSHGFSGEDLIVEIKNYRQFQKKLTEKMPGKVLQNSPESSRETPVDKNRIEEDKNRASRPRPGTSIPPDLEDVKKYCSARGRGVDAEKFMDFYEAKGWLVGRAKMKNWQAAVRTWEKNEYGNTPKKNDTSNLYD